MDMNTVIVGRNAGYESLKSFLLAIRLLGKETSSPEETWE